MQTLIFNKSHLLCHLQQYQLLQILRKVERRLFGTLPWQQPSSSVYWWCVWWLWSCTVLKWGHPLRMLLVAVLREPVWRISCWGLSSWRDEWSSYRKYKELTTHQPPSLLYRSHKSQWRLVSVESAFDSTVMHLSHDQFVGMCRTWYWVWAQYRLTFVKIWTDFACDQWTFTRAVDRRPGAAQCQLITSPPVSLELC